jgi:hypothetical protein
VSSHFYAVCDAHEPPERGPQIRRAAGGWVGFVTRVYADSTAERAQAEWTSFLIDHEWCGQIRLEHE